MKLFADMFLIVVGMQKEISGNAFDGEFSSRYKSLVQQFRTKSAFFNGYQLKQVQEASIGSCYLMNYNN